MGIELVCTQRLTLAGKFNVQYDFEVLDEGDEVQVTITRQRTNERYVLPKAEARQLWASLVKKGYERF